MIDLDLDTNGPKILNHEFKKAELFVKVDDGKDSASLSIIYGTKDTKTTQREFSLSKKRRKEASGLLVNFC